MADWDIELNEALDKFIHYFEYDGDDINDSHELKWEFIDAAVEILEKLTGRSVADECHY